MTFSLLFVNLPGFVTYLDEPSALKWHQAGGEVTQHVKTTTCEEANDKHGLLTLSAHLFIFQSTTTKNPICKSIDVGYATLRTFLFDVQKAIFFPISS